MTSIKNRVGGYLKQLAGEVVGDQSLYEEGKQEVTGAPSFASTTNADATNRLRPDHSAMASVPVATYRLQLRNGMTFEKARLLIPHLLSLGISHLYLSPIFKATSGSQHGYDIVDFDVIDPDLGGYEGFEQLAADLHMSGLSLILDFVPNHMAASIENPWWFSVLEWGQSSRFAGHFDIDWTDKLALPHLSAPLDEVLASDETTLVYDREKAAICLSLSGLNLPIGPSTYDRILAGEDGEHAAAVRALVKRLPAANDMTFHAEMQNLFNEETALSWIDGALSRFAEKTESLSNLYEAQAWRLTDWRDKPRRASYRRFFDVSGLAGIRVEDDRVFEDAHRLLLELVRSGRVDGIRVDHVDGLASPGEYLAKLRREAGQQTYIVVEKILIGDERLPQTWPVDGTTGYEFIASMSQAMTNASGRQQLEDTYRQIAQSPMGAASPEATKRQIIEDAFSGELNGLAELCEQIAALEPSGPKASEENFAAALRDVLIAMPVYRSYGSEDGADTSPVLREAIKTARSGRAASADVFDLLEKSLSSPDGGEAVAKQKLLRTRFEQLSGAVMAKSIEDTLFYRRRAFLAIDEVGDSPLVEKRGLSTFHERMHRETGSSSRGLATSSTHDTKFSEDARARLYTLSEAPALWRDAVEGWRVQNARLVAEVQGAPVPTPSEEWLIYQTLMAIWEEGGWKADPEAFTDRMMRHMTKALREAKLETSWTAVNQPHEQAIEAYLRQLLSVGNSSFVESFCADIAPFVRAGQLNSLSQLIVKMTGPAAPDIYQGCETLNFSLVDPDNRRPVDFEALSSFLAVPLEETFNRAAFSDGRLKFALTSRCLVLRKRHKAAFEWGSYEALDVTGSMSDHVIAYERRLGDEALVVIVPRFPLKHIGPDFPPISPDAWGKTAVIPSKPATRHRNLLTGRTHGPDDMLFLADVLDTCPIAILLES
jgi:(1->4)-alpha-D-glucan 1-alpha-D-glucosylmutase